MRAAPPAAGPETCDAGFEPLDFVMAPYVPPAPVEGKLHPVELFLRTVEAQSGPAGSRRARRTMDDLRAAVGRDHVVWSAKSTGGRLEWELYFYRHVDPERVTAERVARALERTLPNPLAGEARRFGPDWRD